MKELLSPENPEKYDGLIYFIAARGASDGVIYTSKGIELSLQCIFEKFNNQYCPCLRELPKLFFIDAERGEKQNTPRKENAHASHFSQMRKTGKIMGNKSTVSYFNQHQNHNHNEKTQIMSTRPNGKGKGNGNRTGNNNGSRESKITEIERDETKTRDRKR